MNRERAIIAAGLLAITGAAWIYTWRLARDPMALCMVNMNPWSAGDLWALFTMWTVMMVAMMIPSASPMILTFAAANRNRRAQSLPYAATGFFVFGYLAAWTAFSVAATLAQEALHSAALVSSMGIATSRTLGGVLLAMTGIFQWTPLKDACLRQCRTPLGFLMAEWRDGAWGALVMGFRHGVYCVGCCWLLMALLFVAGVMNLWWIAAISAFVLLEKLAPGAGWIARVSGAAMVGWAGWIFYAAK